jgi:hypothetical protein
VGNKNSGVKARVKQKNRNEELSCFFCSAIPPTVKIQLLTLQALRAKQLKNFSNYGSNYHWLLHIP